jgi:DNA mismatch repair protein, C-terminal domain
MVKDIIKLYKMFYRAASGNNDRMPSTVNPFLCMQIQCPPKSYDVNIEPAKDDVLFSEPSKIMTLAEKLFRNYYGQPNSGIYVRGQPSAKGPTGTIFKDSLDLLLARKTSDAAETIIASSQLPSPPLQMDVPQFISPANTGTAKDAVDDGNATTLNSEPPSLFQLDTIPYESTYVERSASHFNMYGTDDEDLLEVNSTPPTQQPKSQDPEENEVWSARVTNPWSLAKLHASTRRRVTQSPIRPDPDTTIQLMTPGFERNDSTKGIQPLGLEQESEHARPNMPRSAALPLTPAFYQNRGHPSRRRVCNNRQDSGNEDDIESTPNMITEASQSRHDDILGRWVQPRQSPVHMPSFQGSSISRNGDHIFEASARSILERQGSSLDDPALTQLTEPNDYGAEPLRVSNNKGKPFESPFKDLSVTSFRSALDLARADSALISPLSATPHEARIPLSNGSPLSHRRLPTANYDIQGSLVPPPPPPGHLFKSSQSPNSELVEILEFEQRKKAAILHQYRSQPSHAHDELRPAKLAYLQRKSNDTTSIQAISSQTRGDLLSPHLGGDGTNPACGFERRFARSSDKKARGVPHRNSPYLNRYLAAKERLDHAHLESSHPRETSHSDSGNGGAGDAIHEADIRLPEDDPRAYLVRQYGNGKHSNRSTGLTKAGLKIRRVKTARLPLETIPADKAVHALNATVRDRFPAVPTLAKMTERHGQFDEYVRSGKNGFITWSANGRDVAVWEKSLKGLISKSFRARLAGETVTPEVTVMLRTAIIAHADAYGL